MGWIIFISTFTPKTWPLLLEKVFGFWDEKNDDDDNNVFDGNELSTVSDMVILNIFIVCSMGFMVEGVLCYCSPNSGTNNEKAYENSVRFK